MIVKTTDDVRGTKGEVNMPNVECSTFVIWHLPFGIQAA